MKYAIKKYRQTIGFTGILLVNFLVMLLIAGAGVYSYTVAAFFDKVSAISMIFTLECLARSISLPMGGRLGDKIGHKRLFLVSLGGYTISYAVAAGATSFWMFAVARAVSGFAWGFFVMNVFVLISRMYGQEKASKYAAYNQSLTTVAMIVAAPIAGLACAVNWRIEFYGAVALLAVGFALCAFGIPDIPPGKGAGGPIDTGGIIASAATLIPFSLAMNLGGVYGWSSPVILALLGGAVVGLLALVTAEKRAKNPVFPIRLFQNPRYLSILMLSLVFAVSNGASNYAAAYAQHILGTGSRAAGLLSLPGLSLAAILTVYLGKRVSAHGRFKGMVVLWSAGTLLGGVCWILLDKMPTASANFVLLFVGLVPLAAVNSVGQVAPYTYPIQVLKADELSSGLAFMGLAAAVGSTLSGGLCGALMNSSGGLHTVLKVPAVCAVMMMALSLAFRDQDGVPHT